MKHSRFFDPRKKGQALILVLGALVLVASLVLLITTGAFYHSQLAADSLNQNKSDLAAQGAINQIVADLRQEIVDGSQTASTGPYTYNPPPYIPNNPASTVPYVNAYTVPAPEPTTPTGLENLIKSSIYNVPFYGGATSYNGAVYNRVGISRASSALSSTPSLNGRSVSKARWEQPCLTAVDSSLTGNYAFTKWTPCWVLVDSMGTTPTTFDATTNSILGTNPITQRYAYTVYDEGSTLDLNVAGFPNNGVPLASSKLYPFKNSLAYADLTQITSIASPLGPGLSAASGQTFVNNLVGWRNNATAHASGNLSSGYTFSATGTGGMSFFDNFVASNTSGFLKVGNGTSSYSSGTAQSDNAFVSRQQMLQFLRAVTPSGTSIGYDQMMGQYFGTFSRDISQPSHVSPALHGGPVIAGLGTTGGNNDVGLDNTPTLIKQVNPDFLNVTVVQTATGANPIAAGFTRNDGSIAMAGEPLVKQRFDLNRIAWLTYQGPIADSNGKLNPSGDPGIANIITALENQYGMSQAFLQQGTPQNVYKYFGLSWVQDNRTTSNGKGTLGDGAYKWYYNHNSTTTPVAVALTTFAGPSPAWSLLNLAQAGVSTTYRTTVPREPDFFELLKAAVVVGSKAKVGTGTGSAADTYQTNQDPVLEYSIMQLGANIIDQFDLDGYPTDIVYQDGSTGTKEFFGIENLPYIYRVRPSMIQGKPPVVLTGAQNPDSTDFPDGTLTNAGWIVSFVTPELWNPHDIYSPRCAVDSKGAFLVGVKGNPIMPINLRVVMDSVNPDDVINDVANLSMSTPGYTTTDTQSIFFYSNVAMTSYRTARPQQSSGGPDKTTPVDPNGPFHNFPPAPTPPPPYNSTTNSPVYYPISLFPVTSASSALYFQLPPNCPGLFRESTLLNQPLLPSGSALTAVPANWQGSVPLSPSTVSYNILDNTISSPKKIPNYNPPTAYAPDFTNIADSNGAIPAAYNNIRMLGFYEGSYPDYFNIYSSFYGSEKLMPPGQLSFGQNDTYRIQYQDPNGIWRTYDQKYVNATAGGYDAIQRDSARREDPNAYIGFSGSVAYDPRTARFGVESSEMVPFKSPGNTGRYGVVSASPGWFDKTVGTKTPATYNNVVLAPFATGTAITNAYVSARPDYNGGYACPTPPLALKWNVATGFSQGDLSQNNPVQTVSTYAFNGDTITQPKPTSLTGVSYPDPDGVVRRAMGAWTNPFTTSSIVGLPMAEAYPTGTGPTSDGSKVIQQTQSRPIILNRPFASVAELGYTFSGTPWKNIDFFTPESGDSPLLDVFCVGEIDNSSGMVAGKVNLNTRQAPVLAALLSAAYLDEQNNYTNGGLTTGSQTPTWAQSNLTSTQAMSIAQALIARTSNTVNKIGKGPLQNVSELVGKYVPGFAPGAPISNYDNQLYDGFSNDLTSVLPNNSSIANIQRFRESSVRALSSGGTTRVWNLMIDVVAQTGRYPTSATTADDFVVEGEQRYWVHIAIDRATGNIIDKSVELIKQ